MRFLSRLALRAIRDKVEEELEAGSEILWLLSCTWIFHVATELKEGSAAWHRHRH